MGSPLGSVIAGIFMVELERSLIPMLSSNRTGWKRYADDTFACIERDAIEHVLSILS